MKNKIKKDLRLRIQSYSFKALFIIIIILLIGSLITFRATDLSFFYFETAGTTQNIFGYFGATIAGALIYFMGRSAFLLIPILLYSVLFLFYPIRLKKEWDRLVGILFFLYASTLFCARYQIAVPGFNRAGGFLGNKGLYVLSRWFDGLVQGVIIYTFLLIALVLILRFSFLPAVKTILSFMHYVAVHDTILSQVVCRIASGIAWFLQGIYFIFHKIIALFQGQAVMNEQSIVSFEREEPIEKDVHEILQDIFWNKYTEKNVSVENFSEQVIPVKKIDPIPSESDAVEKIIETEPQQKKYHLPDTAFMKRIINKQDEKIIQERLQSQAHILEKKLEQFDVTGKITDIHRGPVVTLFEYKPDTHIKLSKIVALEDDLGMALQAMSIRILAPIPGKSVVGFEVANDDRQIVSLASIINSPAFTDAKAALPMVFGENTLGDYIVADLAQMPHLLVAGSTGSGKSVALNTMLISLLCRLTPDELKLIIIDPKRLEFTAYEDIPHLLFPIVKDTRKALPILQWVVVEMETRYEAMAGYGVRNIFEYQSLQKKEDLPVLPFIVLMIDELADLMMVAGKEIEGSLARIAQMARAAGIHMIVATQRPSVDVITGVIKVNFPNRISFKVTSKFDSRTILDTVGSEKLLGKGDMLFLHAQTAQIQRVHGAYVSDSEIEQVVQEIKKQRAVEYLDITEFLLKNKTGSSTDDDDALYDEIIAFLAEIDEISISMLQRKFKIGYNRSARIIEVLESRGLVLPSQGGKTRRVVK